MLNLLNHTINVYPQVYTRDASGGLVINPNTAIFAGIVARVQDASAKQIREYGFRRLETDHVIFVVQPGILNGHTIDWFDAQGNRHYYRVTDVKLRRLEGGIDDFYVIGALEIQ